MNLSQFIDTIESQDGIQFLPPPLSQDGVHIRFYLSTSNKKVMLDCTDEEVDDNEGRANLRKLGLDDLVEILFPHGVDVVVSPELMQSIERGSSKPEE